MALGGLFQKHLGLAEAGAGVRSPRPGAPGEDAGLASGHGVGSGRMPGPGPGRGGGGRSSFGSSALTPCCEASGRRPISGSGSVPRETLHLSPGVLSLWR